MNITQSFGPLRESVQGNHPWQLHGEGLTKKATRSVTGKACGKHLKGKVFARWSAIMRTQRSTVFGGMTGHTTGTSSSGT